MAVIFIARRPRQLTVKLSGARSLRRHSEALFPEPRHVVSLSEPPATAPTIVRRHGMSSTLYCHKQMASPRTSFLVMRSESLKKIPIQMCQPLHPVSTEKLPGTYSAKETSAGLLFEYFSVNSRWLDAAQASTSLFGMPTWRSCANFRCQYSTRWFFSADEVAHATSIASMARLATRRMAPNGEVERPGASPADASFGFCA